MTSHSKWTTSARWNELLQDVFTSAQTPEAAAEWPDAEYAAAALLCRKDRVTLEKLRRLCEDLESLIALTPGPGSIVHASGVPADVLKRFENRCWREVLLDAGLPRLAWLALKNYGQALKGPAMDSGTRRAGAVIHAVAVARLEAAGETESDPQLRQNDLLERQGLRQKPYLTASLQQILEQT